jgi:hypothetical protein
MSDALRIPSTSLPTMQEAAADLPRFRGGRAARLCPVLLGLAAVGWGAATLPQFWRQSAIERTAAYIVDRTAFRPDALLPLLPAVEEAEQSAYCRPEALRSAAIIRMRLAEDAMAAGERDAIDERLGALQDTVRRSLACAPSDSFMWMTLAWLDGARQGFRPEQLQYLALSYRLGPDEGWVAARRNRFALSMFARLPPDLADAAVTEFAHMVQSRIYEDTLAIFTGPGWPIRDRLLTALEDVGEPQRDAFAKALYSKGYDVKVPGVALREPRPWY